MSRTMSVGIFGLGLIGSSLGLDLTRRGHEVTGYDVRPTHARDALSRGAVSRLVDAPAGSYDILVLAAPPLANLALLRCPARAALWLDTSSVKAPIVREAAALSLPFVGGHPLAGSAASGPRAARAEFFCGSTFFLCPAGGPLNIALGLVDELGARPFVIEPEAHDRAVASSSHVVFLMSAALALTLADTPPDFVGPAAREMLRTATSPPELWREILDLNRSQVRQAASSLGHTLGALAAGDLARLDGAREAARRIREESTDAG